jgi:hypothetical protein
MPSASRKAELRRLLERRDPASLRAWAEANRGALRLAFSLTFAQDELLRQRAIEAVGIIAGHLAQTDRGVVRDYLRRLLWLMNDESGGLGWHAPEAIGEILVNVPELIGEFAPLLPHYLAEEPFEAGTHRAIHRIAEIRPQVFTPYLADLRRSLGDPDPAIRALGASVVLVVDPGGGRAAVEKLRHDGRRFTMYDYQTGQLQQSTVGEIIEAAIDKTSPTGHIV